MMRFFGREDELGFLKRMRQTPGAGLVVVSGRRRAGKSRLVEEFLKGRKAVSAIIVPKEERQVAGDISGALREALGYSPEFATVREALEYAFESDVPIIFLDEFPNVLHVNAAIPHELQSLLDRYRERKRTLLILSGSYAGMMNRLFTAKKAPLFNRASGTLVLQPLPIGVVRDMLAGMGVSRPDDVIALYCVLGGVPYYYQLLEGRSLGDPESVIDALFFEPGAQLAEEGENVLRQEFGNAYARYYAILEAIAGGSASMGDISGRLGVRSGTLMKYIQALVQEFRLVERRVPFGEGRFASRKGRYVISDHTLAFWFLHVYGMRHPPDRAGMAAFIGRRFEMVCLDHLLQRLDEAGEKVLRHGRWWGPVQTPSGAHEQREIDLVVETEKRLYIGECKWGGGRFSAGDLAHLRESAGPLLRRNRKELRWVVFSRGGFRPARTPDILVISPTDLVGRG